MNLLRMNRFAQIFASGVTTLFLVSGAFAQPNTLPADIQAVMAKPRYEKATWSLLVGDVDSGETFFPLNEERLSFSGSTRKLFSVGLAMLSLGGDHRFLTTVHRQGQIKGDGVLDGDLVLVASGDLTFGGRRIDDDTIEFTDFDHNDANNLGTAILAPQDPLYALNQLAKEVKASGITSVEGEIAIDDRLFESYRVPNQKLLITPIMVNENQIDVTVTPTRPGENSRLEYRPKTEFFKVEGDVKTVPAGSDDSVEFSGEKLTSGLAGTGEVSGSLPVDYKAPMSALKSFVGTFRVEDPSAFARTAFIEALKRQGIKVSAKTVAENPTSILRAAMAYPKDTQVADFESAPYLQSVRLILKVSLNLGANTALSLFGLEKGERTVEGALAAERKTLTETYGIDGRHFRFPTNGSGSPDSEVAPVAFVKWLTAIRKTPVGAEFQTALPIMGVDGSLAASGTTLPAKGHVFAKTGTTVGAGDDGKAHLIAQCLAGYIETRGGRRLAYALMVNDAGAIDQISDVTEVFEDQCVISSLIYEAL